MWNNFGKNANDRYRTFPSLESGTRSGTLPICVKKGWGVLNARLFTKVGKSVLISPRAGHKARIPAKIAIFRATARTSAGARIPEGTFFLLRNTLLGCLGLLGISLISCEVLVV